jgi:hypothetical protein
MFILTIYFIALNVYVEFVLIYRPHPVLMEEEQANGKQRRRNRLTIEQQRRSMAENLETEKEQADSIALEEKQAVNIDRREARPYRPLARVYLGLHRRPPP